MNVPYHRLIDKATILVPIPDGGYENDDTGQSLVTDRDELVDIPCRITPLSGTDAMAMGGTVGAISYSGLFPSPQVLRDQYGLTDGHIKGTALVQIEANDVLVTYRAVGPATVQRGDRDVLQRVILETENEERPPV